MQGFVQTFDLMVQSNDPIGPASLETRMGRFSLKKYNPLICFIITTITCAYFVGCTESSPARTSETVGNSSFETQSESAHSIVGEWQDEDQLILLDSPTGEPFDIVVGFELDVEREIRNSEQRHQKTVADWMLLKSTRVYTASSHEINSNCITRSNLSEKLSVSAPMILDEQKKIYSFPSEERSNLAAIGVFQCFASIGGNVSRQYILSSDGKNLTIILGESTDEKVSLRRVK